MPLGWGLRMRGPARVRGSRPPGALHWTGSRRGGDCPVEAMRATLPGPELATGTWMTGKKTLAGGIVLLSGLLFVWMDRISAPGAAGWYGLAGLALGLLGLVLMVLDLVRGRDRRGWAAALLGAGVAYAVANAAVFVATLASDRFAIFDRGYVVGVAAVAPLLLWVALLVVALRTRKVGGLGALGFALWILAVAFGHFWMIAQASGSV